MRLDDVSGKKSIKDNKAKCYRLALITCRITCLSMISFHSNFSHCLHRRKRYSAASGNAFKAIESEAEHHRVFICYAEVLTRYVCHLIY